MWMVSFREIEKAATGFFWFKNTLGVKVDSVQMGVLESEKKTLSGWKD